MADTITTTDATVVPTTEVVSHSQAELDSIADEILLLDEDDITGATALATAEVDAETNKVVVEIAAQDDGLADRLGQRYGTDAVTVRVNPGVTQLEATADRWSDKNPFKGEPAMSPTGPPVTRPTRSRRAPPASPGRTGATRTSSVPGTARMPTDT
ncbi:hypothetical protein JHN63_03800 [Streptomyces sp. MBT65]|uniref:hypothetical protein n=1 Tax=Streptomyces sp. MBT65 TaxID=1488395 RepID=UPI00190A3ABB|nr:hypothetical protein [Streptomyces sp. MBT65]MBK3572961.1 hypothetical protein [Streptomyces sp. MBT65]